MDPDRLLDRCCGKCSAQRRIDMPSFRQGVVMAIALVGGACLAAATAGSGFAQQGDTQNGALTAGPIGASGDTMPAKYSAKNDADDKLPIGAYRLKHLSAEQRQAIYRDVMRETAHGRPDDKVHPAIGTLVPSSVALQPVPADASAQVPDTNDLKFAVTQDKVVLVDPVSMMVVGVLPN
jgi:hypothetical protein